MNDAVEDQLINMGKHLLKIHKHRMSVNDNKQINLSDTNGVIDLGVVNIKVQTHTANLKLENTKDFQVS